MPSLQWSRWPLIVWLSSELFDLAKKTLEHRKTVKKKQENSTDIKKNSEKIWKTPKTSHGVDVFPTYLTCQTEILVDMCHVYHLSSAVRPSKFGESKLPAFPTQNIGEMLRNTGTTFMLGRQFLTNRQSPPISVFNNLCHSIGADENRHVFNDKCYPQTTQNNHPSVFSPTALGLFPPSWGTGGYRQ